MLNIPLSLLEQCNKKQNILIAGIGGGFDVFGGLPLYYTLKRLGKSVHLANYSFTNFDSILQQAEPEIVNSDLLGANSIILGFPDYYPEGYLSEWFKNHYAEWFKRVHPNLHFDESNSNVPVWMFRKTGVKPLVASYQYLIKRLEIDLIILIDGGVDSLNTGFEEGSGTILEDSISIAALSMIDVDKVVMCIGFGTEVEEKVCGVNVLRNMSNLIRSNAFIGSCSLVPKMKSYDLYKSVCLHVFNKENHKTSHIHRRIIPAVEGEFGNFHATDEDQQLEIFISPFMSVAWFFEFNTLYSFNQVVPYLMETISFHDAVQEAVPIIKNNNRYPRTVIPY